MSGNSLTTPADNFEISRDTSSVLVIDQIGGNVESELLLFEPILHNYKAIVVIGAPTGGLPSYIDSFIRKQTDSGRPIFIIGSNYEYTQSAPLGNYQTISAPKNAGAIYLEKPNINSLQEVVNFIQGQISKGLKSPELADVVYRQYAYKKGEDRPSDRYDPQIGRQVWNGGDSLDDIL